MSGARTRLRTFGAVIAAGLVVLVAFSPTLLFGQSPSAFGLVLTGAGVLGLGLLARWAGGAAGRTLGAILVAIGALIVALALGLLGLVLAGWGRAY